MENHLEFPTEKINLSCKTLNTTVILSKIRLYLCSYLLYKYVNLTADSKVVLVGSDFTIARTPLHFTASCKSAICNFSNYNGKKHIFST